MNNVVLLLFALCLGVTASAQRTEYYALTKKVHNGTPSTNVSGGQFISFLSDVCYESNKKGDGVGHGILSLNRNYSNENFKLYMGDSYWGSSATFKFKSDLSVLNVVLENGDVYVYKRQIAPATATTCSLIRKKDNTANGGSSAAGSVYMPAYPDYGNNNVIQNNGGTSGSSDRRTTTTTRKQPTRHTCSVCNGKRRIVHDSPQSLFGTADYKVWCGECNRDFMRSTGHSHITCPQCHGKGYFTTD